MAEAYGIIYKATNKINGKIYIGQTVKSLDKRMKRHIRDTKRLNTYFSRALKKYGKENFEWKIIVECNSLEELNKTEVEMIEKCNTFESENGYNTTSGGEKVRGFKISKKVRKEMSEKRKGKNNGMYGKHHTKEAREKMSEAWKDREFSDEHRRKLSEAGKKRIFTKETRRKISEAQRGEKHHFYGKHHSEETKKKLSDANKGKEISRETKEKRSLKIKRGSKNPRAKKYIIITPNNEEIIVHGIRDFCRNYKAEKLDHCNLIKVAQGKHKQHKGYKCKYMGVNMASTW